MYFLAFRLSHTHLFFNFFFQCLVICVFPISSVLLWSSNGTSLDSDFLFCRLAIAVQCHMFPYMTPLVCVFWLSKCLSVFAFTIWNISSEELVDTNWSIYQQVSLAQHSFTLSFFQLVIDFAFHLDACLTGPNAVEFIINHAEVSIAFVQEKKIPSVCSSSLITVFFYYF